MIRNAIPDRLRNYFQKENLRELIKDVNVLVDTLPYAETFGAGKERLNTTFGEFEMYMDTAFEVDHLPGHDTKFLLFSDTGLTASDELRIVTKTALGEADESDRGSFYIFENYNMSSGRETKEGSRGATSTSEAKQTFITEMAKLVASGRPKVLAPNVHFMDSESIHFYTGPAYSGAAIHWHEAAWNGLAFGRKRWLMHPPIWAEVSNVPAWKYYSSIYPSFFANETLQEDGFYDFEDYKSDGGPRVPEQKKYPRRGRGRPLSCVQHPGDVIFVPLFWGHLAINYQETIGIAQEISRKDDKGGLRVQQGLQQALQNLQESGGDVRNWMF